MRSPVAAVMIPVPHCRWGVMEPESMPPFTEAESYFAPWPFHFGGPGGGRSGPADSCRDGGVGVKGAGEQALRNDRLLISTVQTECHHKREHSLLS